MTEARRAMVVGGAGGIGSEICRRLATQGYRLVVADLDVASADQVRAGLPGAGHEMAGIDVTSAHSVRDAFATVEASGPLAVLVLASGGPLVPVGQQVDVTTMDHDDWDRSLALNLTGVFLCVQAFARLRTAAPIGDARIVILGSAAGELGGSGTDIAYGVSKAALIGLTRQAAVELASAGITVNNVAPGPVGTAEFMRRTTESLRVGLAARAPLKRLATPEDVSAGVAYLLSREAACITGATLAINGGLHMH